MTLIKVGLLINGHIVQGEESTPIINPATEAPFASAAAASDAQLERALDAATRAFPAWSRRPWGERMSALRALGKVLERNAEELARLITQEVGKPLASARYELRRAAEMLEEAVRLELPVVSSQTPQRTIEQRRQPLGVVAAISTWNYPLMSFVSKAPIALLAGNTVIAKPSPDAPVSVLRFAELVAEVLPPGVLNVIHGRPALGAALASHPGIKCVSFTGSTRTGRQVMRGAADHLSRLVLELGGNDAAIVLDDAVPSKIVSGIMRAAFHNAGQTCIAIKRLFVHDRVYDQMCDALARHADAIVVGNGMDEGVEMGPVQSASQLARVKEFIEDARAHGRIISGGAAKGPGYFVRPTIVRDVQPGTRIVDEEQFGPVLPIIRFSDEEEAIDQANSSLYGLGGSVWSSNIERARALAMRLEVGTAWVNTHMELAPGVPMGGAKASGVGLEHGVAGLSEFTQLRVLRVPATAT